MHTNFKIPQDMELYIPKRWDKFIPFSLASQSMGVVFSYVTVYFALLIRDTDCWVYQYITVAVSSIYIEASY